MNRVERRLLRITSDAILTKENVSRSAKEELLGKLHACSQKGRETTLQLLDVF